MIPSQSTCDRVPPKPQQRLISKSNRSIRQTLHANRITRIPPQSQEIFQGLVDLFIDAGCHLRSTIDHLASRAFRR